MGSSDFRGREWPLEGDWSRLIEDAHFITRDLILQSRTRVGAADELLALHAGCQAGTYASWRSDGSRLSLGPWRDLGRGAWDLPGLTALRDGLKGEYPRRVQLTVNVTRPAPYHQDVVEPDRCCRSIMLKAGRGRALTIFPQLRVAIRLTHGDVLSFDSHLWHGVLVEGDGPRITIVQVLESPRG